MYCAGAWYERFTPATFIYVLLLLISTPAGASIIISAESSSFNLSQRVYYFVDEDNSYTIERFRKDLNPEQLIKNTRNVYSGGNSSYAHWITTTFTVTSDNSAYVDRLLELGFPTLEHIRLYIFKDGTLLDYQAAGSTKPFSDRPYKNPLFIFPVNLPTNTPLELIIHIQNDGPVSLPIKLWKAEAHANYTAKRQLSIGVYIGIMLGLAIYNLFIFISVRDRSYLFYTLHLITMVGLGLGISGLGTQYIWGEHARISFIISVYMGYLAHYFAIAFTRSFLNTAFYCPTIDSILKITDWAILAYLPFILILPKSFSMQIISLAIFVGVAIIILAGIICLTKGLKTARLFLLAWGAYEISAIIKIGDLLGWFPESFFTFYAIQFGSAFESIFLSLALADRINQMKRERQALQEMALRESQESNRLKDQFLATISHELRTPMNGVEGAIQLLEQENHLSPDAKSYIAAGKSSAKNMTALIEKILHFSEIQSGKLKINPRQFKLTSLVDHIEKSMLDQINDKNLSFEWEFHIDENEEYIGDIEHIVVVMKQLIENAIKFTHEGDVRFSIRKHSQGDQSHKSIIELKVSDTGIGIPKENTNQIFESFRQLESSHTRGYGGLGIGLATCKRLAELMGGELTLDSELGHGSQFTFTVPLEHTVCAIDPNNEQTKNTNSHAKPRILITEDNGVNQMILASMLKKIGCTTITADNGQEALNVLKDHEVDLILMDCQMPVMDGFDTTRAIRKLNLPHMDLPIIAVTANAMSTDRARCLEAGMNDYLKKPVNLNELQRTLEKWLPQLLNKEKS